MSFDGGVRHIGWETDSDAGYVQQRPNSIKKYGDAWTLKRYLVSRKVGYSARNADFFDPKSRLFKPKKYLF
jgi:hypothetical protein